MSKSLGNFFTIRDVLQKVHPEALRLFVLSKHYRSPVDFSDETVADAERGLERLYGTLATVMDRTAEPVGTTPDQVLKAQDPDLWEEIARLPAEFEEAMDNDFNTAQAIGYLFGLQRHVQRFLDRFGQKKLKGASSVLARHAATKLVEHARILGLLERDPSAFLEEQRTLKIRETGLSEEDVNTAIRLRDEARRDKNFAEADRIRTDLEAKRIQLEDTPSGTRWRVGSAAN
jgi:cysteinyl-tRNA synthetase